MTMEAALHLAHTDITPSRTEKHDSGGGGDETFYETVGRIYADERATPLARELLIALAYAIREHPSDGVEQWAFVRRVMGRGRGGESRLSEAVAADAPRYVPPGYDNAAYDRYQHVCHGPRVRPWRRRAGFAGDPADVARAREREESDFRNTENMCGSRASDIFVVEKLPGTGWWKIHYFCKRHKPEADRLREQLREPNEAAPQPIPNRGGLLDSYFESNWLGAYRKARGQQYEPPAYGLRADAWPVPGREPVPPRPRLRLVAPMYLDGGAGEGE